MTEVLGSGGCSKRVLTCSSLCKTESLSFPLYPWIHSLTLAAAAAAAADFSGSIIDAADPNRITEFSCSPASTSLLFVSSSRLLCFTVTTILLNRLPVSTFRV
uniref:Uncharacterized protein n=1 Tax=Cryptomonas curvata TaxID=233186 RepID=A0A7S0MEL2_9CRYP